MKAESYLVRSTLGVNRGFESLRAHLRRKTLGDVRDVERRSGHRLSLTFRRVILIIHVVNKGT